MPLKFLKALLPDPAQPRPAHQGQDLHRLPGRRARKDGKPKAAFIYNICDHEACYREVQSQAISYTTGVPAMIGAMMMLTGKWRGSGVFNMEQFDPDPFMDGSQPLRPALDADDARCAHGLRRARASSASASST